MKGMKVTVVYYCNNMIDDDSLKEFNNDAMKAYREISDNFTDIPENFSNRSEVVSVEIIENIKD